MMSQRIEYVYDLDGEICLEDAGNAIRSSNEQKW
jgi:hypothetical protein